MPKDTKRCIKDFIRHVEMLEVEEDPDGNGFDKEYKKIHEVQMQRRKDNTFTMDIGKTESNLKKNRYKDILPYDEHRVILSTVEGEEDSDYINASKLKGVHGTGGYIASQGPLASTVNDFWRMIWEYKVEIIFMACRIVELGKIKCKQYWNDVGKSDVFGDITVFTEDDREIASDFQQRRLLVTKGEEQRIVTQFHYSGWPDHGIPDDPDHIRDLIGIMRRARQNDEVPLLIHCSAGCGRTGAIAAIDFVWTLLEEGKFDETFNLYELICEFRKQRMSIVQTAEQYALVNQVLKSLCQEWLARMASHTYENVEVEQESISDTQQNYANEVENVYEDSQSLRDDGNQESHQRNSQGPEVISLHTVVPTNTENHTFRDRVPSQKAPAPPPPVASAEPKTSPIHSTIIQVGSPKHAMPGGKNSFEHLPQSSSESSDNETSQTDPNLSGVPTSTITTSESSSVSTVPPAGIGKSQSLQLNSTTSAELDSYANKRKSFTLPQDLVTRL
ncbi:protein tyrosine phosphatase, non-receptor type 12 [Bulinus truncatus]|nr:protein tyrosine phosphatase, non-receptor type 12 [Bulinus truncatus]